MPARCCFELVAVAGGKRKTKVLSVFFFHYVREMHKSVTHLHMRSACDLVAIIKECCLSLDTIIAPVSNYCVPVSII